MWDICQGRTMSPLCLRNASKSLGQMTQKANMCLFGHTEGAGSLNLGHDLQSAFLTPRHIYCWYSVCVTHFKPIKSQKPGRSEKKSLESAEILPK